MVGSGKGFRPLIGVIISNLRQLRRFQALEIVSVPLSGLSFLIYPSFDGKYSHCYRFRPLIGVIISNQNRL